MKNASRRHHRPQVEPLESLSLLSTLLVGAYQGGPLTSLNEGLTQASQAMLGQTVAHGTVTTLTVDSSTRSSPAAAKIGTTYSLGVAATGHPSTALPSTATRTAETLTVARPQAGAINGLNTTISGIVPVNTRSILINPLTIGTAARTSATASTPARVVSSLEVSPFSKATGKLT